ncbi:MAG: FG-GAP repeat protein [Chloroflexota bacterium]
MMKRTAVTFALALIGFFASTTHAQATLVTFPAPPDQQPGDAFGTAVAVDNNTAVVTAPNHDDGNGEPGAAYVYTFDGATWTFQQELTPPDADGSGFGMAVDISGDLIAVGAARDNSFTGAVYVFALENNTWSYEAKYLAPDGEAGDAFGFSVALAGDTMAVGATGYDAPAEGGGTLGSSGAVYAFIRTAGEFTPQPVLIPDDIVPGSLLGFSVDVHVSRTIIAGAPFANEQTGAAYHFFSCLCGPWGSPHITKDGANCLPLGIIWPASFRMRSSLVRKGSSGLLSGLSLSAIHLSNLSERPR